MLKEQVKELLDKALEERPSLFLVSLSVGGDNRILVTLDGDRGVSLKDCIEVSRAIEHNLDREEQDFALEVSSAGAASPLVLPRQYKKNLGRTLAVRTVEGDFEGKLAEANEDHVVLEWKAREPKPVGKGKVTVQKRQEIKLSDVEEAKVIIKF